MTIKKAKRLRGPAIPLYVLDDFEYYKPELHSPRKLSEINTDNSGNNDDALEADDQ